MRPRQNGRHFPDDIFKCIFLNENFGISIKISLKFVSKGLINNIPALVQIMAWRRPGDKPLSEPMLVSLLMHICMSYRIRVCISNNNHFNHFKLILVIDVWGISSGIEYNWTNIGSYNSFVPSNNKPLTESMLTQIYYHMASFDHNELNYGMLLLNGCLGNQTLELGHGRIMAQEGLIGIQLFVQISSDLWNFSLDRLTMFKSPAGHLIDPNINVTSGKMTKTCWGFVPFFCLFVNKLE